MTELQAYADFFNVEKPLNQQKKKNTISPLLRHSDIDHRLRRDNWKRFLNTGKICEQSVPTAIANSWRRCKELSINPSLLRCENFACPKTIEDLSLAFADIALNIEEDILKAIKNKGLLFSVTDAHGRILRMSGEKKTLRLAHDLHFELGAIWSEESVGTNAICLSLIEQAPVQLSGEDHFCSSQHGWGCAAAPIFSPTGQLWGCFDISGPYSADHSQALWLAITAARKIEQALFKSAFFIMEDQIKATLNTAFDSVSLGVCVVNKDYQITYINNIAEQMLTSGKKTLKQQNDILVGKSAKYFFDFNALVNISNISSSAQPFNLECLCNPSLQAQITPLTQPNKATSYALITLQNTSHQISKQPYVLAKALKQNKNKSQVSAFDEIIYQSTAMTNLIEQAAFIAKSDAPVLIYGETGTGKGLFAKAIHQASQRAQNPFVALNCGSLPQELIQSELFGYEKGAFTGASKKGKLGKFELAKGGTLFLDEISEMNLDLQTNLLRPLEERCLTRLGGQKEIALDFRLITATNRPLEQLVSSGKLREDIFYRIHVLTLQIPPLRERKADIKPLIENQCTLLAQKYNFDVSSVSSSALQILEDYHWPGNVRQLIHCMEFAVTMSQGKTIIPKHLPSYLQQEKTNTPSTNDLVKAVDDFSLNSAEEQTIRAAIKHFDGNMLQAAKALGIGRNTLYAKLRKMQI